jgi:HAD superfamily phosphoserine phosphatase-like hydrolase
MKINKFLLDLDGTITREELLPRIAHAAGVAGEIADLTRKTIAGEIPFASSFRRRVQILSDVPVSMVRKVAADVPLDPHIMAFIAANRDRCVIVTGNLDIWISDLVERIGLPTLSSRATAVDDRIVELNHILDKEEACAAFDAPFCAIGDGNNDRGMLSRATIGVAFGGVHQPARSLYEVATHAVFEAKTLCALLSQW